ncbi:MAG: nucleotidyltransferase domain-containing protein [Hyphomonas sp.]|nr:nucleotidyltransferase domain-containing protein [Hyphomonas sp.]
MSGLAYDAVIDPGRRSEIERGIRDIEAANQVKILFAIESGSRAWGFPSPDSDYDVRFVYAHTADSYLSVFDRRDVIELPIEGDLDINGWDIRKALALLLKPNPVLLEWLSSPIRYKWNESACQPLLDFAHAVVAPGECVPHYYHLARRQWQRNIEGETAVNLKKYFYVLRPALAIRWVRLHPGLLPPMNFQELVSRVDIDPGLQAEISDLLQAKARASEVGSGKRIAALDDLIEAELAWGEENSGQKHVTSAAERAMADELFRKLVK